MRPQVLPVLTAAQRSVDGERSDVWTQSARFYLRDRDRSSTDKAARWLVVKLNERQNSSYKLCMRAEMLANERGETNSWQGERQVYLMVGNSGALTICDGLNADIDYEYSRVSMTWKQGEVGSCVASSQSQRNGARLSIRIRNECEFQAPQYGCPYY
jgi:hypothetical protein